MFDVAIIGGGVIGSLCARELSRYDLDVCLIEKCSDVAMGASKANSGIVHAGFDAECGTLKAKLNVSGCSMMEETARELDVTYKKIPSIVVCTDENDLDKLNALYERGVKNGVKDLRIICKDELKKIEPNLTDKAVAALYAPSAGVVCPYELTIKACSNAITNGLCLKLDTKVVGICEKDGNYVIDCEKEKIECRYIINAAGLFSDEIADMCRDRDFSLKARRGEYMLFDKSCKNVVNNVVFTLPTEKGKGILVAPTADGNILIGPNANECEKGNTETTKEGLCEIHEGALKMIPSLPSLKNVITSFAGQRPTPDTHDFIIRFSKTMPHVLYLAGIESPGLASSPAIAKYALELLESVGLKLSKKENFIAENKKQVRMHLYTNEEKEVAVKRDARYAHVVCRCETVTEGEIIDAIKMPCGATTIDGVKRRTRAGMGRCQGGFCMPTVTQIIARELSKKENDVTKSGVGSNILMDRTK